MAGLLDFLADPVERRQIGANALAATTRGIVAGGLGAPVDMLHTLANLGIAGVGYLGNKAGLIPHDKLPALLPEPVGGSEWIGRQMQKGGLLSGYRNPNAELIAGGLLAPAATVAVQARAPQIARGLLQMQENAAKPSTLRNVSQRGIFGGELAQTADKAALAKAKALEGKGTDPRAIWQETGWFKGGDGKWRFEIDDSNSVPGHRLYSWGEAEDLKQGSSTAVQRQKALLHPELSAAYPETKRIGVVLKPNAGDSGSYSPEWRNITVGVGPNGAANRSTMLHELQHAIQEREGFAAGGNPAMFPDAETLNNAQLLAARMRRGDSPSQAAAWLRETLGKTASPKAFDLAMGDKAQLAKLGASPETAYRNLAGEAEARAVQARMNMTPAQRRATFPLDSYDVPIDSLIYWNGR